MLPQRTSDALEDWDLFVLRHSNMKNVAVHFVSALFFWLGPILAILISPYYLVLFFISGLIGAVGHYVYKDGAVNVKETTSSAQVVIFSTLMAYLFITKKYAAEIARVSLKYNDYTSGKISSNANPALFNQLGQRSNG